MMNRSVKEIAKYLGTNKNVVYRLINKNGLEPVSGSDSGSKVYDDESFLIIKTEFRKLQTKHQDSDSRQPGGESSELIEVLREQIRRNEMEIDQLRDQIREKDQAILELTDKITKMVESTNLVRVRDQELLAREQETRLMIESSHSETRFNLFRPSTWRRNKPEPVSVTPLTEPGSDGE